MRKIGCIILTAAMTLSVFVPAFAKSGAVNLPDQGFEVRVCGDGVSVGAPVYTTDNGKVNMSIEGNSQDEKSITAVFAAYTKDNMLKSLTYDEKSVSGPFSLTASLDAADGEDVVYKTFLTDNISAGFIYTDNFDTSLAGGMKFSQYGWNFSDGTAISSEDKHEGFSSLALFGGSAETSVVSDPNEIYKLSFYKKGAPVSYTVNGNEEQGAENSEWDIAGTAFETGEDGKIDISFNANGEKVFLDDITVNKNLVANPGFENGLDGYAQKDGETVSENVLDGFNALSINGTVSQNLSVIGGKEYILVYYSKGGENTLCVKDGAGNILAEKTFAASEDYRYNYLEFYAPDKDISFEISSDSGCIADELKLEKTDNNTVKNSALEYGITTLWEIHFGGKDAHLTAVEGVDGKNGVMVTGRTKDYVGIKQYIGDEINKYGTGSYKLSGYAKFPNGNGDNSLAFSIYFRGVDSDSKTQKSYGPTFKGLGNDWTYFERTLDITSFGKDEGGNDITDACIVSPNSGFIRAYIPNPTDDFALCGLKLVKIS